MTAVRFQIRGIDAESAAAYIAAHQGDIRRAVLARRRRRLRPTRKPIEFSRMVKRIADQHGVQAAQAWTQAVLRHQKGIDLARLRSAIASKNVSSIEAVVKSSALQQNVARSLRQPFQASAAAAGTQSAAILKGHGLAASFNAVHPNVVNFARTQAAQLVVAVPAETKQVIAEVIALGAQHGLDVAQQARAIREVVGLPPNWASAPLNLRNEIRNGDVSAATGRRLSAVTKQQIRSRMAAGTVTDAFLDDVTETYAASLINRRALNIARTETLRASHNGLTESWKQAQEQGVLPETARRFWIVTPDDRLSPEHARIPGMNPNGRGMDEPFETTEGPHMYPPSRPNCRCSVGLLPNVPEDFDVTEGAEEEQEPLRRVVEPEDESSPISPESAEAQLDALPAHERQGRIANPLPVPEDTDVLREEIKAGIREVSERPDMPLQLWGSRVTTTQDVSVSQLVSLQDTVVRSDVRELLRANWAEMPPLQVVRHRGVNYVWDGNHRAAAARTLGRRTVRAEIFDLDAAKVGRFPSQRPSPTLRPVIPISDLPAPKIVEGTSRAAVDAVHGDVVATLREMNVDPDVLTYNSKLSPFKLGGKAQQVAGEYSNGRIFLDPRARPEDLRMIVTHEAQHLKFDVALKTDPKIRRFIDQNYAALRREDGTTAYSKEHWLAYERRLKLLTNVPVETIPVNETLAEIRAAMATGEGEAFLGSAKYRKLLRMVDDAYAKAQAQGRAIPSGRAAKLRGVVPQTPRINAAARAAELPDSSLGPGIAQNPLPRITSPAQAEGAVRDRVRSMLSGVQLEASAWDAFATVKDVPLSKIVSEQKWIDRKALIKIIGREESPPISLVKMGDKYILWDGNHRTVAARLLGQQSIRARVLDLSTLRRQIRLAQAGAT